MQRFPRKPGFVESDDPGRLSLEDQLALAQAPKLPPGDPRRGVDWKDVAGKVWASPNTALGLGLGGVGYALGQLNRLRPGDQPDPRVQIGHNAVEFIHNPMMQLGALTLGNTTNYVGDPYDPKDPWAGYPKDHGGHTVQEHEEPHTYQAQRLGPAYIPANALGGLMGLIRDGNWHGPSNWMERGPLENPPRPWPSRGR